MGDTKETMKGTRQEKAWTGARKGQTQTGVRLEKVGRHQINIKLKPRKKADGDAFFFASLPENIQVSMGASMQSFELLSKGIVKVPKGRDAKEVKWSGEFFGKEKKNEPFVKKKRWKKPEKCVKQLKKWMNQGTVLNLVVSRTWINMDVTIASLEVEEYGAYGNIRYTITLVQYRDLKIYTTKENGAGSGLNQASGKKTKERSGDGAGNAKGSYTVVSGDTLWGIAARHCGGGQNWTKLYDANAAVIEEEARKHGRASSDHGHWIWPGEVLVLV